MEDEWELRWVRVPKGTHLSKSKDSDGAERDLLREDGTNKLLGPTESIPADESDLYDAVSYEDTSPTGSGGAERSWGAQLAADVIEDVVNSIDWEAVFEHVVVPAVKRTRARVTNRVRSTFRRTKTEVVPLVPDASPESSALVGAEATDTTFVMSREEYRQRVTAALAAEAFAAWQREVLANSRVEEDDVPAELLRAVTLVLEGNTSMLAESELAALMDFLEEGRLGARSHELSQVSESEKPQ